MSASLGQRYSAEELFEIFKEQHRLFSPHDPEADPFAELTPDSSVADWRDATDLLPARALALYFNKAFELDAPIEAWVTVLEPSDERTMRQVCEFLSQHAFKETIAPVRLLGQECLTAATFLWLKAKLGKAGIDVSGLRPSTPIAEYKKHFGLLMHEVLRQGVHTIDMIELEKFPLSEAWRYVVAFLFPHGSSGRRLLTGDVVTFRDLVERLVEARPLGSVQVPSTR